MTTGKIAKQDAQKILNNVPQEFVFWCHKGGILNNLNELRDALNMMSDDDYAYHANSHKNDFSKWVKEVIKDDKLAGDLSKAKARPQAAKSVADRVATLQKAK